jgi:C1A family cysteine protease
MLSLSIIIMKYILALGVGLVALTGFYMTTTSHSDLDDQFQAFITEYRKSYFSASEYNLRKANFAATLDMIAQRNAEDPTAKHGITKFADWSQEEFEAILGYKAKGEVLESHNVPYTPKQSDWSKHTTPIKDQGSCGSCWAFSAVEAVETAHELLTGDLIDMSEQQLVDCDPVSYGCNGGWMDSAIDFMEKQGSWSTEAEYPYHAKDQTCTSKGGNVELAVKHHREFSSTSQLNEVLASETAPSVGVDASNWSTYTGGVLSKCGTSINHGVQAVGVNADGSWKLRNSWGARWGESGYINLAAGNTCGVASEVSVPSQ